MREALQPAGRFLQDAHYKQVDAQLTPGQVAELGRLEKAWLSAPDTAHGKNGSVEPQGSGRVYTLRHLPVPLSVKTKPGTAVLFHSQDGGHFENGLSIAEVKSDPVTGLATAWWVTHGDAIAECAVCYRSVSAAPPEEETKVIVVRLALKPPPGVEVPGPPPSAPPSGPRAPRPSGQPAP